MKMKNMIVAISLVVSLPILVFGKGPGKSGDTLDPKWAKENQRLVSLLKEKKADKALEKARGMLDYLKKQHLSDSQEAATTHNNLGMIHLSKGQFDKAEDHLLKALNLRTTIFGKKSLEVAIIWLNLSQLYKLQAEYIIKLHEEKGAGKKAQGTED